MKAARKYLVGLAGASLALTALATGVTNCGGSSSSETSEGGNETDGTTNDTGSSGGQPETSVVEDANPQDGTTQTEASGGDAQRDVVGPDSPGSDAADASLDQAAADGGPGDGGVDGPAEAETDSGGDADANAPDAADASALLAFPGQVATTLCTTIGNCCYGVGSDELDMEKCLSVLGGSGFRDSNLGSNLIPNGHVVFDAVKAQTCLSQLAAIDCTTDIFTTAVMGVLYPNCFGAMTGTLPTGAPCGNAIECAPGEFCDPADAGDASMTCQPLRTSGQSCADFGSDFTSASTACSYRASGDTQLTCNTAPSDPAAWTCTPEFTAGSACELDLDCQTKMCTSVDGGFACGSAEAVTNAATCTFFKIVDAGPG